MKTKSVILVICLMGLTISASAQKKHGHHRAQLQEVVTISGTVTEWTHNDDFEYDGLYLNAENSRVFVKFPKHLAQQARALGNNLTVNGVYRTTRHGVQEFKMVSMSGNGQTVHDQKPMRTYVQEPFVSGEGRVSQMQVNKSGAVHGYILDNGVVLRTSPRNAWQLAQMIQVGSTIGYTGIEKGLKPGHVRAQDYRIVRGQTISVGGTQYMVR